MNVSCHCEERSDKAISTYCELDCFADPVLRNEVLAITIEIVVLNASKFV